jgi:hypothetical protein
VRFELTVLGICNPLHWAALPPHYIETHWYLGVYVQSSPAGSLYFNSPSNLDRDSTQCVSIWCLYRSYCLTYTAIVANKSFRVNLAVSNRSSLKQGLGPVYFGTVEISNLGRGKSSIAIGLFNDCVVQSVIVNVAHASPFYNKKAPVCLVPGLLNVIKIKLTIREPSSIGTQSSNLGITLIQDVG